MCGELTTEIITVGYIKGEKNSPCNYSAEKRPAKCGVNLSARGNGKAAIRLSGALNDSGAYSWTAVTLTVWDCKLKYPAS